MLTGCACIVGTKVNVYVANPSICKTNLSRNFSAYQSAVVKGLMAPIWWLFLHNPEDGANIVVNCALEPSLAFETGRMYGYVIHAFIYFEVFRDRPVILNMPDCQYI